MDKRERTAKQRQKDIRQHQEDIALTKMLYWFGGAVVLEGILFLVRKYYINFVLNETGIALMEGIHVALMVLTFAGVALAGLACFWGVQRRKRVRETILPWALAVLSFGIAICSGLIWALGESAASLLVYLVPVAAVLALVYYLYQHEFFLIALLSTLGILGLWVLNRGASRGWLVYLVLAGIAVLLAAAAVISRLLQKRGGKLKVGGREVVLLGKNAGYALLYITCALMALVLVAALALGAAVSAMVYYAVPVAWLLVMAVYYTVKLM